MRDTVLYLGSSSDLSTLGLHFLNGTEEVCLGQGHAPYRQVLLSLPTQHRVKTSKSKMECETCPCGTHIGGRGSVRGGAQSGTCEGEGLTEGHVRGRGSVRDM